EAGGGIRRPAGGLAMANVDDAAIVEVPAARAVALYDVVVPVVGSQLKVLPGIEESAVVLAQPFPVRAQLNPVPLSPEALEILSPPDSALLIELLQDAVGGDGGEVAPIAGYGCRIVVGSALVVGRSPIEPAEEEQSARYLEQTQAAVGPVLEITVESRQGRI